MIQSAKMLSKYFASRVTFDKIWLSTMLLYFLSNFQVC